MPEDRHGMNVYARIARTTEGANRMSRTSALFLLLLVVPVAAEPPAEVVLTARWLIDGKSATPLENASLLIRGHTIAAVGRVTVPPGARTIDLGDATLLPGLIDCHSHPLIQSLDYQTTHLQESSAYKALRGLKAVQECLRCGWTTLRVAGDADVHHAVIDLRRAIEKGLFVGPRLVGAAHYLTTTGGGGDYNTISHEQAIIPDGKIVDGVDAMRRTVREEIKRGSDWIKVLVTGAYMAAGNNPHNVQFSQEELDICVAEARRWGVPVMAHAHATDGIKMAIRAGVRSIEHGTFADDEALQMMKAKHIFLVPTVYCGDYYPPMASAPVPDKHEEKNRWLRMAIKAQVPLAIGTDLGGVPPHTNWKEFAEFVKAGLTPMAAIQAGTSAAAELLGMSKEIGTLEPGKRADVIAVKGNLLADITQLGNIRLVIRDGAVFHSTP
jgi:imidazolonepropionase-like amidohydrolase